MGLAESCLMSLNVESTLKFIGLLAAPCSSNICPKMTLQLLLLLVELHKEVVPLLWIRQIYFLWQGVYKRPS